MPVPTSVQQRRGRCCEEGFLTLDTVRGVQVERGDEKKSSWEMDRGGGKKEDGKGNLLI